MHVDSSAFVQSLFGRGAALEGQGAEVADDADDAGGAVSEVRGTRRALWSATGRALPSRLERLLPTAYALSFAAAALSEASFLAASWIFLLRVLAS